MNALLPHVEDLENQIGTQTLPSPQWGPWCLSSLNGAASRELRRNANPSSRKANGVFFTNAPLADRAARALGVNPSERHVYLDPTCGAGDLLIAIARRLPLESTVNATLATWGKHLIGCDLSSVFVRATRARLALLAMYRLGAREPITREALSALLPSIACRNTLTHPAIYQHSTRVIMNPPFLAIDVPEGCSWSSGLTNSAACFAESAIRWANPGTRLVAILPDVVRSGARYDRWRTMLSRIATIEEVDLYGTFDNSTDVDVFLLCVTVQDPSGLPHPDWGRPPYSTDTVSNHFKVHVGAVVPHRHPELGPNHPYVHSASLSPWSTRYRIHDTRHFRGRVFKPPFVAIKRTSSPRDPKRAVATIVHGTHDIAVENHLIVCLPHDNATHSCHQLLTRLRSSKTDDWLNRRIRCRHLTVGCIAELPWWPQP